MADDQVPDSWSELRTPHFTIISNASEKNATEIAEHFEKIRAALPQFFPLPVPRIDPAQPVLILAMKDETSLAKLLPEYWSEEGRARPGGIFYREFDGNFIALRTDAEGRFRYHVVYHEYAHLATDRDLSFLPVWLIEGIAEFVGNATVENGSVQIGRANDVAIHELKTERAIPLETLFAATRDSSYYNETDLAGMFYAESWAIVKYLLLGPDTQSRANFSRYVDLVKGGEDPVAAAKEAFGDLALLQNRVRDYLSGFQVYEVKTAVDPQGDAPVPVVSTISQADADGFMGFFSLERGDLTLAAPLLQSAAQGDPSLAIAQEGLGLLKFKSGDPTTALEYFAKAISLDPSNYLSYFYRARMTLLIDPAGEGKSEASTDFNQCISLNPNFAPAYDALARIDADDRTKFDQALSAARKAVDLDPSSFLYLKDLGVLLVRMDDLKGARDVSSQLHARAKIASELSSAEMLDQNIAQRADYDDKLRNAGQLSTRSWASGGQGPPPQPEYGAMGAGGRRGSIAAGVNSSGRVTAVQCTASAFEIVLTKGQMEIHLRALATDIAGITDANGNPFDPGPGCQELIGKNASVSYSPIEGNEMNASHVVIRLTD
jgi:tetratricopeptide (TPR) repeat protein